MLFRSLSFATVGATAGQVIQVLGATDTSNRSTTSTSFVTASNTLSVSITPSATANKILILVNIGQVNADNGYFTIYRGSTNLGSGSKSALAYFNGAAVAWNSSMIYLDSPSTTSATTYQVYIKSNGGGTCTMYNSVATATITCMEIKG